MRGVQGEGVDREVAPRQVLMERRAVAVPEIHVHLLADQAVGGELLAAEEDQAGRKRLRQPLGDLAAPRGHDRVDVLERQPQRAVAQHAADQMGLDIPGGGDQGLHRGVVEEEAEGARGHGGIVWRTAVPLDDRERPVHGTPARSDGIFVTGSEYPDPQEEYRRHGLDGS